MIAPLTLGWVSIGNWMKELVAAQTGGSVEIFKSIKFLWSDWCVNFLLLSGCILYNILFWNLSKNCRVLVSHLIMHETNTVDKVLLLHFLKVVGRWSDSRKGSLTLSRITFSQLSVVWSVQVTTDWTVYKNPRSVRGNTAIRWCAPDGVETR